MFGRKKTESKLNQLISALKEARLIRVWDHSSQPLIEKDGPNYEDHFKTPLYEIKHLRDELDDLRDKFNLLKDYLKVELEEVPAKPATPSSIRFRKKQ